MRVLLLSVLCLITAFALAQEADTTMLEAVEIYGAPVTDYAVGSRIETVGGGSSRNLATLLENIPSVYFKNYGNGQMSTIGMRGTSASQTAVLWHGLNINSPTLGQTDFSIIPGFFFDQVAIQYGSTSSLYGSGSIGGSIVLAYSPPVFENKPVVVEVLGEVGSFGRFVSGIKADVSRKQYRVRTSIIRSALANRFPYRSPAVGYEKIQEHAAVSGFGINQLIDIAVNEKARLSADLMYNFNRREVQPAVTSSGGSDILTDRNYRGALTFEQASGQTIFHSTLAYIHNYQRFDYGVSEVNRSSQLSGIITWNCSISQSSSVMYGATLGWQSASSIYHDQAHAQHAEVYASYRRSWSPRVHSSLNIRQSAFSNDHYPLTPSLGVEISVFERSNHKLLFNGQAGRGFRTPTLNDMFWNPGGNENITAEKSQHYETGFRYFVSRGKVKNSLRLSAYHTRVRDMINWTRGNNNFMWSPVNLQRVRIDGLEFNLNSIFALREIDIECNASYAFTQSVNQLPLHPSDLSTVDKQMPYVPEHSGTTSVKTVIGKWSGSVRCSFVGMRYSDLSNGTTTRMPAYALLGLELNRTINLKRVTVRVASAIDNLGDIYYENLRNHAMPGRSYSIRLQLIYQ